MKIEAHFDVLEMGTIVHLISCQKVDSRAFVVTSVQFSAQSHKSV